MTQQHHENQPLQQHVSISELKQHEPICIIPARSGSKGLLDKNMLFLDNKPMIFHTIDAAIASGVFTLQNIIVSTDSSLYRDVCLTRGIRVVMRCAELASDTATTFDVLENLLQTFPTDQLFVLLQPTSPLRRSDQIQEALQLYVSDPNVEHVVSCKAIDKHPRLFSRLSKDGYLQDIVGIDRGYRRQDEEPLYVPNGAIFISTKEHYLKEQSFFTKRTKAYLMDQKTSVDIDSKTDFTQALGMLYFDYSTREQKNRPYFSEQYQLLNQQPTEKGVIVGDSRMLAIQLNDYQNMAIGGVTLETALAHLDVIVHDQLERAFVSIGVNDLICGYRLEHIQANFKRLFEHLRQRNVTIYCTTVAYALFRETVDSHQVKQLNDWLKDYCNGQQIPLLDINDYLAENDKLRFDCTTDGLHFNAKTNRWLQQAYEQFITTPYPTSK